MAQKSPKIDLVRFFSEIELKKNSLNSTDYIQELNSARVFIEWAYSEKLISTTEFLTANSKVNELLLHSTSEVLPSTNNNPRLPKVPNYSYKVNSNRLKNGLIYSILSMVILGFIWFGSSLILKDKHVEQKLDPPLETQITGRVLNFKGKIPNSLIGHTQKLDMYFSLYNEKNAIKSIYTGKCIQEHALKVNVDGIFAVAIGQDCGMPRISKTIITENNNLYLGVAVGTSKNELKPRYLINTVDSSKNAQNLAGKAVGTDSSSIPYINSEGNIVLTATSPSLKATNGNFTIEGESLTLKTPSGSSGSVFLFPDSGGDVVIPEARLAIGKDFANTEIDVGGSVNIDSFLYFSGTNSKIFQSEGTPIGFYIDNNEENAKPALEVLGGDVNGIRVDKSIQFRSKGFIETSDNADLYLGTENTGNIFINSSKKLGLLTNKIVGDITIGGSIAPSENNKLDIGSTKAQIRALYTNNVIISGNGIGAFWQRNNEVLSPLSGISKIVLGSTTANNPVISVSSKTNDATYFNNKLFGVGTSNPHYLFSAVGESDSNAVASITNLSTSDNSSKSVLKLQLRNSTDVSKASFIEFNVKTRNDENGIKIGSIYQSGDKVVYETVGADFAEYFPSSIPITSGSIVSLGKSGLEIAKPNSHIIGIVSNTAGFIGNAKSKSSKSILVGLMGQVELNVTSENGELEVGDYVGVSNIIDGYGRKVSSSDLRIGLVSAISRSSETVCPKQIKDFKKAEIVCRKVLVLIDKR